VGLTIWTAAVAVNGDGDRGGGADSGDSDDENNKMVKRVETVREVVDNGNGW
jgi:hypothetical protein